ncbi:hypothetical protein R5R35_013905 [Gryllus longicercus]
MCDSDESPFPIREIKNELFVMYQQAVSAVKPGRLVSRIVKKCDDKNYIIKGRKYVFNKNVYVVGFGKAVLDMALKVNEVFGEHIVEGILSVPEGIKNPPGVEEIKKRNIQIREGAAKNLPDKKAESTAREIGRLADSLGDGMILMVLISGGGSALLPAPVPGITVEDTAQLVSKLQCNGATITEVNSVRKKLCTLKGGKLAIRANPARVITFILSDVIGDPLDFIASGPTVKNEDPSVLPLEIIEKYHLQTQIKSNIVQELKKQQKTIDFPQNNVYNVLIGNNLTALLAAKEAAINKGYFPILLSDKISCPVAELSEWYSTLCVTFWKAQETRNSTDLKEVLHLAVEKYGFTDEVVELFLSFVPKFREGAFKGLCIIGGGEPTVVVHKRCGSKGGRSQELALRFSVKIHELANQEECDNMACVLMAAGTDGIDGPTDAAGGFGYLEQIDIANAIGLDAKTYIERSNSYAYFSALPRDMIKIGHTGTNVMDLHIIMIKKLRRK